MSLPNGPFFRWLASRRLVQRLQAFLRTLQPWGQEGMNVYDVLRFFLVGGERSRGDPGCGHFIPFVLAFFRPSSSS